MAFLTNLFTYLPNSVPTLLYHQAHSADLEFGVGGSHAKPCRACTDFKSWMHAAKEKQQKNKDSNTSSANKAESVDSVSSHGKECPLDKDELGRNSWSLLHTMAAYYPEKPSQEDQIVMNNFIQALARFYPCEPCAIDFRHDIRDNPPDTKSRVALSNWWCQAHNRVNRKLNKPEFDCSKIDERWLDGWKDGSCG